MQRACIAAVQQAQAQPAARHRLLRILYAVSQHHIAEPADRGAHDIELVVDAAAVLSEPLVLEDQRHIVRAPLRRQPQLVGLIVLQQDQPSQALRHLMAGFAMQMWMEPAGRGGLIGRKADLTRRAGFDTRHRPAVAVAGDRQSVPVQRRRFRQLVIDIDRRRFAAPQHDGRPQQTAVVAPCRHILALPLAGAGHGGDLDLAARIGLQP